MPLRGVGMAGAAPVLRTARPAPPSHAIDRYALRARLDSLLAAHRVVVLAAPAGFGKTSTLAVWTGATRHRVAWLTLSRNDRQAPQLARRVLRALDGLGLSLRGNDPVPTGSGDDGDGGDHELRVLVVDDTQYLVGSGPRSVLLQLIEQAPPGLRIVLAGRHEPPLGLTRLAASGDLGLLGHADLAFSPEEVEAAARAIGAPVTAERAREVHSLTKGWPVMVRLALMSWETFEAGLSTALRIASDADIPQLADYLVENVIAELPASLREFVPRACTCDWVTGRLASELGGNSNGPELLERALALGLPIERHGMWHGEPVYRWHPVMAQAGRAILLRRDPQLAHELNRVAARFLAVVEPYEAASHALRGHDPELAARLIGRNWLSALMRGDTDLVEELCALLPAVWTEDPDILMIRAACLRIAGDRLAAAELADRSALAANQLGADRRRGYEVTRLLASLFLSDAEDVLTEASARARRTLAEEPALDGSLRACATLLLGWTELKLRHVALACHLLREATQLCRAEGLEVLASRARAYHTYALAFSGDFVGARSRLEEASELQPDARWRLTDGDVETYTRGYIAFWSGDHDTALAEFQSAVGGVGAPTAFSHLSRIGLVLAALARGHAREIALAEPLLDDIPTVTVQGLPWGIWVAVARAGILLARGEADAAADLLDRVLGPAVVVPAMMPLAAEIYFRCGRRSRARAIAAALSLDQPAHFRITGLVITALCDRSDGAGRRAHDALEEALDLGSTLGLERAFHLPDPALGDLLLEHAAQGTRHDAFLAAQIAYQRGYLQQAVVNGLSGREQEILSHLATTLTAAEICQALFISSNTLKTHLRSIYRKLGVDNRHDAVRLTYGEAIQVLPRRSG